MYYYKGKGKRLHLIEPSSLNKYNIITKKQKPIKLSQFSKRDQAKILKAPKRFKYVPLPVGPRAEENKIIKKYKTLPHEKTKEPQSSKSVKKAVYVFDVEKFKMSKRINLRLSHPDKGGVPEVFRNVYAIYQELAEIENPTQEDIERAEAAIFPLKLFYDVEPKKDEEIDQLVDDIQQENKAEAKDLGISIDDYLSSLKPEDFEQKVKKTRKRSGLPNKPRRSKEEIEAEKKEKAERKAKKAELARIKKEAEEAKKPSKIATEDLSEQEKIDALRKLKEEPPPKPAELVEAEPALSRKNSKEKPAVLSTTEPSEAVLSEEEQLQRKLSAERKAKADSKRLLKEQKAEAKRAEEEAKALEPPKQKSPKKRANIVDPYESESTAPYDEEPPPKPSVIYITLGGIQVPRTPETIALARKEKRELKALRDAEEERLRLKREAEERQLIALSKKDSDEESDVETPVKAKAKSPEQLKQEKKDRIAKIKKEIITQDSLHSETAKSLTRVSNELSRFEHDPTSLTYKQFAKQLKELKLEKQEYLDKISALQTELSELTTFGAKAKAKPSPQKASSTKMSEKEIAEKKEREQKALRELLLQEEAQRIVRMKQQVEETAELARREQANREIRALSLPSDELGVTGNYARQQGANQPKSLFTPPISPKSESDDLSLPSGHWGNGLKGNGINFKHIKMGTLTEQYNEYNDQFHHKIPTLEAFAHVVITHPKMFDDKLVKKAHFYVNVLEHYKTRK